MEKTIPIQVHHVHSRSEPVDSGFHGNQNVPIDSVRDRIHQFMPENSYFQHKFPRSFASTDASKEAHAPEARVHHIPIHVETRNNSTIPLTKQSMSTGQQQQQPQPTIYTSQASQPINPQSQSRPTRVIEVPIQITKSSSSPDTSKRSDNVCQSQSVANVNAAENSNNNNNVPINTTITSNLNESASDPLIADPNTVYAMGYESLSNEKPTISNVTETVQKKETPFDFVKEVLDDLANYESQVNEFNGNDANDKGYRYLDEMLTLCILRLDCINIDGNDELRKYRKSAINDVNRVAALLETKVSKSNNESEQQQPKSQDVESQSVGGSSSIALPLNESDAVNKEQTDTNMNNDEKSTPSSAPLDKKETKKLEKAKAKKEKEEKAKVKKESGEKGEGRRIILFRSKKNKAKDDANGGTENNDNRTTPANDTTTTTIDLDRNNNDLKDDASQSTSDHTEVDSTSTSSNSTTTLKGKETAV